MTKTTTDESRCEVIHNYIVGKRAQARLKKVVQMGFECIQIYWGDSGTITIEASGNYVHPEQQTHDAKQDTIRALSWLSVDDATRQLMFLAKNCKAKNNE